MIIRREFFFFDMKCQQFLVHVFLDCKLSFACFDWNTVLSAGYGCHISPARGTRNFDLQPALSGNRHKFTSMFNCASLVHPCTSVACCQTKFQVPLTVLKIHPYFSERCSITVKHGKDCFHSKKKNMYFRTVGFSSPKQAIAE